MTAGKEKKALAEPLNAAAMDLVKLFIVYTSLS